MRAVGEGLLLVFGACGFVVILALAAIHLLVWAANRPLVRTGRPPRRKNPLMA